MTHKAKALGAALGAILVLVAMAAPGAQAQQGFVTAEEEVTLTAEETGLEVNFLQAFGDRLECPGSTYTGHEVETTPHDLLPTTFTQVTLTPHYKEANENCRLAGLDWVATIYMNGCDYLLKLGETAEEHTYASTVDVVCPVGEEITITFWTSDEDHTSEFTAKTKRVCVFHVPPQVGLTGAHATDTNTNDGHVELNGTIEGITVFRNDPDDHTSLFCPDGTHTENAKFSIDATVKGHNAARDPVAIKLSHE